MKSIILIAPPAAGKGTISKYLVENSGYTHLSTGDLLRKEIKLETEIGKQIKELTASGNLTPDNIILPLFKSELLNIKDKPFILDGVPRTLTQAKYLTDLFEELNVNNYVVINMEVSKETLERRVVGRRYCTNCGSSYNIYFEDFKPQNENICNKCQKELIQREDDNLETFQNRYEVYSKEAKPLIHYYEEKDLLKKIDASLSNKEIIEQVLEVVND